MCYITLNSHNRLKRHSTCNIPRVILNFPIDKSITSVLTNLQHCCKRISNPQPLFYTIMTFPIVFYQQSIQDDVISGNMSITVSGKNAAMTVPQSEFICVPVCFDFYPPSFEKYDCDHPHTSLTFGQTCFTTDG